MFFFSNDGYVPKFWWAFHSDTVTPSKVKTILKRGFRENYWKENSRFHIVCGLHHEIESTKRSRVSGDAPESVKVYVEQTYDKLLEECKREIESMHYKIGGTTIVLCPSMMV